MATRDATTQDASGATRDGSRASLRASLFNRRGFPSSQLELALQVFGCATLADLEHKANAADLTPAALFRYRRQGNAHAPGRLARYLFNLSSGQETRRARALADCAHGAGI